MEKGDLLVVVDHPTRGQLIGRIPADAEAIPDAAGHYTFRFESLIGDADWISIPESWLVTAVTL